MYVECLQAMFCSFEVLVSQVVGDIDRYIGVAQAMFGND